MNGFDFKGVRQIKSEVKVFLMTAFVVEDDSDFTMRFKSTILMASSKSRSR